MKKFVRAIYQNMSCFAYIGKKMPPLSSQKIKAEIFDGP